MRGGSFFGTLKNAISDLQDTPTHWATGIGNTVASGSQFLSKYMHNSPVAPELPSRLVDDILGNSRAGRSTSGVWDQLVD